MSILKILLLVCSVCALLIPTKHALHIFQQNRYEIKRLNEWIKENFAFNVKHSLICIVICIVACVLSIVLKNEGGSIGQICMLVILSIVLYANEKKQNYIKPLVFTPRVIRQCVVMAVLSLVVTVVFLLNDLDPCMCIVAYFLQ